MFTGEKYTKNDIQYLGEVKEFKKNGKGRI